MLSSLRVIFWRVRRGGRRESRQDNSKGSWRSSPNTHTWWKLWMGTPCSRQWVRTGAYPVIPVLGWLGQEDSHEFETSLAYIRSSGLT